MKYTFVLCLFAMSLILVKSQYPIELVNVLTERVPSDGMLILDTTGFIYPLYDGRFIPGTFNLYAANQETKEQTKLDCFFYQFEGRLNPETPKIGCLLRNLEEGEYYLEPSINPIFFIEARTKFELQPYLEQFNFTVFKGSELYFYKDDGTPDEEFEEFHDNKEIEFSLFEYAQSSISSTIYFDNMPVSCNTFGAKLRCRVNASQFEQLRYKVYTVYIEDSENNVKRNYFVNPISVTLDYK